MSDAIHLRHDGDVAVITLDRPERRNALGAEQLQALAAAVERAASERLRALVLTGAHGHFCAGADLSTVEDREFATVVRSTLDRLAGLPVPTIAAIEGACMGLGLQLAVSCDLRVATHDARIGVPAAKLGIITDLWTVQRVAALAGQGTARAVLLAAETLSGDDAHRLGLVQRVGEREVALTWAQEITRLAPLTQRGFKLGLDSCLPRPADPAYDEAFAAVWASDDLQEGIRAFHEKRLPAFDGR